MLKFCLYFIQVRKNREVKKGSKHSGGKMEEKIDLREYFFILKKKMWLICLSAIVCGAISGLVSFFVLEPV